MILDVKTMLFNMLANQMIVSHLDKKIKFNVAEADKCSSKFKTAVDKEQNKNFLKDADYVIQFAEPVVAGQTSDVQKDEDTEDNDEPQNVDNEEPKEDVSKEEDNKEEDNKEEDKGGEEGTEETKDSEEKEEEEDKDEEGTEETKDAEEEDKEEEDKEDDEDKDEENLNESKIEDITSSMCSTIKTNVKTGTKPCSCGKKIVKEKEKSEKNKKKEEPKKEEPKKEEDKVVATEAETEASGDELKLKVQKAIKKTFDIPDSEKIEFFDLPGFAEGYNIYFAKLSFKDSKEAVKEPKSDSSSDKESEEK